MKVKAVPSGWIFREGRRLDVGPYMSGALEATMRLEEMPVGKSRLGDLALSGDQGVFHAGREARTWVEDAEYGVPFLSSSDILKANLSSLPLIARKQVLVNPKLTIREGWTLITRSGTIGRMVYARQDMDGMACSEHVMRVAPDSKIIPPGYLFAYLSGTFGVPLVISGTYGAIIQHIEPRHIVDLTVPRLGTEIERRSHDLVAAAARLRVEANRNLEKAVALTLETWGVSDLQRNVRRQPDVQLVDASRVSRSSRLDAFYYGHAARQSDCLLSRIAKRLRVARLGSVVEEVFETPRFGRCTVEDTSYGLPFLSISDLVRFDPRTDVLVSKAQVQTMRAAVSVGWLILPRVGQLQGVFGTVCYIPRHLDGVAVSDNNIRIIPADEESGAYLWAALSTRIVYLQIIRRACGTSIPYLDAKRVAEVPVPWPAKKDRSRVAELVIKAMADRSQATGDEDKARSLVERAIEDVT